MATGFSEAHYPKDFRKEDVSTLQDHLFHRHSVELVGAKRVGISNFLRFYLYNNKNVGADKQGEDSDLYISVDLNDLVEREIFPFWRLVLKRIVDRAGQSGLNPVLKQKINQLFANCIQFNDLFLTVDAVRESLTLITQAGFDPTLFLIRFDRLSHVLSEEFLGNLKGIKEATNQRLVYVFTSYRKLDELAPQAFRRSSLSVFSHIQYIKPAQPKDIEVIYRTFQEKYSLSLTPGTVEKILLLSGGHVQYLQLLLIAIHEINRKQKLSQTSIIKKIISDERIGLQSEELFTSLTKEEQSLVAKLSAGKIPSRQEKNENDYLWQTAMILDGSGVPRIFSRLFSQYITNKISDGDEKTDINLTRKENLLFRILEKFNNKVCEREEIIRSVWPEYAEIGISDWAVDRLVARLRAKLKLTGKKDKITTVKTRGFSLSKE